MLTTDECRDYLNIPNGMDEQLLAQAIQCGYDYLTDAIDDFDALYTENELFKRRADAWVKFYYVPDTYDQREGAYDGTRLEMNRPARAALTQLQLYRKEGKQ